METIVERFTTSQPKPNPKDPPQNSTNTYRMGIPDHKRKFPVIEGRQIVETVIKERLSEFQQYDPALAGDMCRGIADAVTAKVKDLRCDRYRFVCHAAIFTDVGQTVKSVSRFLWDQKSDNYVTCTHDGEDFSVVVSLFAVYLE